MSSRSQKSLIDLKTRSASQILDLFSLAKNISKAAIAPKFSGQTAALVFFEASTRTRLSFETACARLGLHPLILSGKAGTSLEKGETAEDTLLNVAAMKPSVLIVRSDDSLDQEKISSQLDMPFLNAGWGKRGHPTQALLDAYTIWNRRGGCIEGEKVLIIGDVVHSRVAASHFELAKILNYEVALCGPKEFLPASGGAKVFTDLKEALKWCTCAMALRVQNERHISLSTEKLPSENYSLHFGLNRENIAGLGKDILILHPGPVNHGIEIDEVAYHDSRSVILEQVTNGVLIRQALIQSALTEGVL